MTARTLANLVAKSMLSKKATDVVIMDVRTLTSAADYFVLCTADSDVQVRAVADAIENDTEDKGHRAWHSEGRRASVWIVLDYVDVVAHVFHRETRSFYNLERLWAEAKMRRIEDKPVRTKAAVRRTDAGRKRSAGT